MSCEPSNHLIAEAIQILGSQKALANAAGLSQQFISKLLLKERAISAETAIAIDRATSATVSKHRLRPDLWPLSEIIAVPAPKYPGVQGVP